MLNIKNGSAIETDTKEAVDKIIASINQDEIRLVMFFASIKYDFYTVSRLMKEAFPDSDVIGCTTAGEIGPDGFCEGSISAMSIAADDFQTSTYIMKNIKSWSMLTKNDLITSGGKIGLSSDSSSEGFIISLTDGIQSSEEKVMNAISNTFPHLGIVGGSAADDQKFVETLVSANGEVWKDAAVVTFIKTSKKFFLYKENIYVPTDIQFNVTKADISNRIVYEFDGIPAAEKYAETLGVSIADLQDYFISNPIGRIIMNSVWISSPVTVLEDNSIKTYSAIAQGAKVRILKPLDSMTECRKTVQAIKENLPNCKGILLFNCIYRYLKQKKENICPQLAEEYSKLGPICGFDTYGEQFNGLHVNQTLTLVAFGE